MEIARGRVTDRPWALTLAQVVRRGVTGEVTLTAADKRYAIAFTEGAIIAAHSPLTIDSVLRIALTSRLITPPQLDDLQRRIAANPDADEIDTLGAATNLAAAQLDKLRADVVTRRAARTFAPDTGEFVITDQITLPARACTVDFRAVVYRGVRMHMSNERLSNEMRALGGSFFILNPDTPPDLHKYGFCDGEEPLFASLRVGTTLPELEARHRDIDPRTMLAAIYALVACGAVRVTAPPASRATPIAPAAAATSGPSDSLRAPVRAAVPSESLRAPSRAGGASESPRTPSRIAADESESLRPARIAAEPVAPRTATAPVSRPTSIHRTPTMNVARTPTFERMQSPTVARTPTAPTARTRTPTVPPPAGTSPRSPVAPVVPPATPRGRRGTGAPPYVALARGTQDAVEPPVQTKSNAELAAEAVERANRALASDKPEAAVLDLKRAVELVPNHVDYNALLGWALFCAADDKRAVYAESRKLLEKALYKSDKPEIAQFYLGRVERILGRDKEALRHFHAVLDIQPDHRDASAEVRVLEARLKRLGITLKP